MATAGILEDMFSGYGFEYLHFKQDNNYAYGLELFNVKKEIMNGFWTSRLREYFFKS